MEATVRQYNCKDVELLVVSDTVVNSAIRHKAILQEKRSNWADPYFEDFKERIDLVGKTYLGVDSAQQLRLATQVLTGVQKAALRDLSEVKVQIDVDFDEDRARRTEILKQLGFTDYLKRSQQKDQEALISLLYQFRKNLSNGLKTEITGKGTAAAALETIIGYADTLKNADVTQEGFKSSKSEMPAAAIAAFNGVYKEVMSICKMAARFFVADPAVKKQFGFSKVLKDLNNHPGNDGPPPPPAA